MIARPVESAAAPSPSSDPLWLRYRATGDPEARALLLQRHLGLVHQAAHAIGRRAAGLELDDLVGAGTLGLVQALETFDLSRGFAFSTHAVRRIRGAILDDLRARDWLPRSVRAKGHRLSNAVRALEARQGRAPAPTAVAAELEIDLETYWEWRSAVEGATVVPLGGPHEADAAGGIEETLSDAEAPLPGDALEADERATRLRAAIARLPERERTVLALYYYEGLPLRQIAEVMHVTESRISQVRSAAIRRLRQLGVE